jgi:hypothetical protein
LCFCDLLSQFLNPKTFLMCSLYSPARRSAVVLWISTVTLGTVGFIPSGRCSSNGTETFSNRFVQCELRLRLGRVQQDFQVLVVQPVRRLARPTWINRMFTRAGNSTPTVSLA